MTMNNERRFQPLSASGAIFLASLVFFGLFFFWPISQSVSSAFFTREGHFTMDYILEILTNPIYLEGLGNALQMGIWSTLLAGIIAVPLAWISDRFTFPGKPLFSALVLVPMIMPPFVGAIGLRQILGQQGALNALLEAAGLMNSNHPIDWLGAGRLWGVVVLNALHLYPVLYLNVAAALANIDPAMEEAAENLGCSHLRKFRRITFPLIMPGLFAGGTVVFIWAFTELGVPLMFDFTKITSVQIFNGIKDLGGNPIPFALVTVMLGTTIALYATSKFLLRGSHHAMLAKSTTLGGPRPARGFKGILCIATFGLVSLLAMLPHLGVILVAFSTDWYQSILPSGWTIEHFQAALGHNLTLPSIQNSLKYASLATLVDLVFGIAMAYVVARTTLYGRHILDTLTMLPLAVPGLVLAFGYLAMTQEGKVFATLNPAVDPLILIVIAYSVRRLPYVVRSAVAGFQQTSVTLEEAAQNLGCPPFKTFCKITLPLISANLIAGGLLAFSFAMLEVSDSLILAQKQQDFPITKAIYELDQLLGEGRYIASALGVWAMVFLGITILGASLVLGKKMGAIFRG